MKKLCFSRILNPCSKAATYDFSNKLLEQPNFGKHHIYRSLTVFAQHFDQIQAELYKNSLKLGQRNTGVIYYDCTNFFFEIEEPGADGLRQYGKGKEIPVDNDDFMEKFAKRKTQTTFEDLLQVSTTQRTERLPKSQGSTLINP